MKLLNKTLLGGLIAAGGLLMASHSAMAVGEQVLFIKGGEITTGGHERGSDTDRTEQGASILNFTTVGGNHGWGQFADAIRDLGYVPEEISEAQGNQDAGNGPERNQGRQFAGEPVDLANMDLSPYSVIVLGSNNAVYQTADVDAVEQYVINGGSLLVISDSNFGSNQADASDSDQQFLDRFGLIMNQDLGTYTVTKNDHAVISDHPILNNVNAFDGEGVTPISLAERAPNGVSRQIIVRVPSGQTLRQNNASADPDRNGTRRGFTRTARANDGVLVEATLGSGRVLAHFDRNTFFNDRGAGTWLTRSRDVNGLALQNTQYAQNLIEYLVTGEVSGVASQTPVQPTPPISPSEPTPTDEQGRLERSAWVLNASNTQNQVSAAVDGNLSTRWATRQPQQAGQTFEIDLGSELSINRLVLNSGEHPDDYPRGYILSASVDGSNFQTVANGNGTQTVVDINFAQGNYRYLAIEQTGSTSSNWWTIAEVDVYSAEPPVATDPTPEPSPEPAPLPTPAPTADQFAFGAAFQTIPGLIEAESYDEGGEGVAYSDSDPQQRGEFHRQREGVDVGDSSSASDQRFVGWIQDGEWLEYTTQITPGQYNVNFRVADPRNPNGSISLLIDGQAVAQLSVPQTSDWQNYVDVSVNDVDLSGFSGEHIVRLEFSQGSFNVDSMRFSQITNADTVNIIETTEPANEPLRSAFISTAIPGRIEAENYDQGAAGVTHSDSDNGNNGQAYRTDDVDIVPSLDNGGGYNIAWVRDNEWLEYSVATVAAGTYNLEVRVAAPSNSPGGSIQLTLGGVVLGSAEVSRTGGWQTWQTLRLNNVTLNGGTDQVLRLDVQGRSFNLNWLEFTQQ